MVKSREWSRKTREEVITLHTKGNGYKKIAKMLNIPRETIGSIIRKFKAKGTVETLPGRGRKKMLTSTAVRYLKRRVEKSPRVTAEELRKDLSDVGTEVSAQTIRRTLRNEGLHARTRQIFSQFLSSHTGTFLHSMLQVAHSSQSQHLLSATTRKRFNSALCLEFANDASYGLSWYV
uniref:Transposase Tc1-like domain-containing protein n=1 Tax=Leptobrachium leishanense TaxID=445787 RepID=A0A8C5Q9Z5_9ANUR